MLKNWLSSHRIPMVTLAFYLGFFVASAHLLLSQLEEKEQELIDDAEALKPVSPFSDDKTYAGEVAKRHEED